MNGGFRRRFGARRSPRGGGAGAGPPSTRGRVFDLPLSEDVQRELRFHIDMKVQELTAKGWTEEAARAEAMRLFGDAQAVEAECRTITERQRRALRRAWLLDALRQDLRFGARMLARRPGFALGAILTLALGIGANAAVFSVLNGLLLRPLPYAQADRITTLRELNAGGKRIPVAEPNYFDWKERAHAFEAMAAYRGPGYTPVQAGHGPVRLPYSIVSGEFFQVMRALPLIGRLPSPAEVTAGAPDVAVVSRACWQEVLDAERDLAHVSLHIGAQPVPVVAVLPDEFSFPGGTQIWVVRYPDAGGTRTSHNYEAVARLGPGISLNAARREMADIGSQLAAAYAGQIDAQSVAVTPLAEDLYGAYRDPLLLLLAAAGVVLLVACTNLASSLLARATAREREVAVRASLGASRLRLLRQLLTESLLLSVLGGGAGLALGELGLRVLRALAPAAALQLRELHIDLAVLAFTLLASVGAALLFGLLPALRARPENAASLLRGGDRGGTGRRSRLWDALIAVEVALALVLLVALGLLVRSFRSILAVDPGFDAHNVLTVDVYVPTAMQPTDTAVGLLESQLVTAFQRLPGVSAAGVISQLPVLGGLNGVLEIEGRSEGYAEYRAASEGYFQAMRIPLRRGRMFEAADRMGSPGVALVDETFAAQFFPGEDPIGRRIRNLSNDAFYYRGQDWLTIIGVVGSVRQRGFLRPPDASVYVLSRQRPLRTRDGVLTLRAGRITPGLVQGVRATMASVAPGVPFDIGNAEDRIEATFSDRRFALLVILGFTAIALTLAAAGIHGVVSYSVARRTREIGIRIALGAVPRGVARRIIGEAMRVVAFGLLLGLLGSLLATRLITGLLVNVRPTEPLTLGTVTLLLAAVASLASAVPALRATRVDPIQALRSD